MNRYRNNNKSFNNISFGNYTDLKYYVGYSHIKRKIPRKNKAFFAESDRAIPVKTFITTHIQKFKLSNKQ